MKLLIIGNVGGTHVGSSFYRASLELGFEVKIIDSKSAQSNNQFINSAFWRLFSRKFPYQRAFNKRVRDEVENYMPDLMISTGHNPLQRVTLLKISKMGVFMVHFSTDDPWNQSQKANWFLASLKAYDVIFTPRKSNVNDFNNLGVKRVEYLPFAFDNLLYEEMNYNFNSCIDLLFVGGADNDRIDFFKQLSKEFKKITLVGAYWQNHSELKQYSVGILNQIEIAKLTKQAKINICLVRKANRDGHVMRSYEIAGLGGCILAEDTQEHRDLFGQEGTRALYFKSANEAILKINRLLNDENLRTEMMRNIVVIKQNATYLKRLESIIELAK
jgi:spore maturation protein CgeB